MSLFDKVKNKRYNLQERSGDFTDKQQADNVRMLDNLFGTKGKAKKTAKTVKNRFFTDKSDSDTLKTKSTGDEGQFRRNANRSVVNRQLKKTIPGKSKKVTVGALDARDTSIGKLDDVIIKAKKGDAAKTARKIKKLQKDLTKPKPGEVTGAKKIVKKFTSGVDQRDVSQKAKEFTKKINIKEFIKDHKLTITINELFKL